MDQTEYDNLEGHYDECPASTDPKARCKCDAITAEAEAYYNDPHDLAAREWGSTRVTSG